MNQLIFILVSTLFFANASHAAFFPEGDLSVKIYQQATQVAISKAPIKCSPFADGARWSTADLTEFIKNTTSVEVNESAAQPLLVFSFNKGQEGTSYDHYVTSDQSLKNVVSVHFVQRNCTRVSQVVNNGNLQKPDIQTVSKLDCKTTFETHCQ